MLSSILVSDGNVVGMTGEWKISKDSAYTGQGLELVAGRAGRSLVRTGGRLAACVNAIASLDRICLNLQAPRLTDRKTFSLLTDRHRKQVRLESIASTSGPMSAAFDLEYDFLSLKKGHSSTDQSIAGVGGQAREHDDHSSGGDSDSLSEEYVEDADVDGQSYDTYVQERNKEFQRHLESHPNDTALWLELAAFQDEVHDKLSMPGAVSSSRSRRVLPQAQKRSLAEIKISILDRALAQPGNEASYDLNLGLLQYGAEVWDIRETMKRWHSLLRMYPEERRFWLEYISFRQTRATLFTLQDTVDVYTDCILRLDKAARQLPRNGIEREAIEENLLYLFLRACFLLRQAGESCATRIVWAAMQWSSLCLFKMRCVGLQAFRSVQLLLSKA